MRPLPTRRAAPVAAPRSAPPTRPAPRAHLLRALSLALAALLVGACSGTEADVVVYVAHDQVHAEEILARFESETGLTVRARFDVEANKTVGLVAALRAERDHPRCDVFWNNESANTVALAEEGLFTPYRPPTAEGVPAAFRDPADRWTGFGARARILIVNTERVDPATSYAPLGDAGPGGLDDLFAPAWAGAAGLARPLTGTTLTHFAALFELLGVERAEALAQRIAAANAAGEVNLAKGNGHVMRLVSDGQWAFGWTDTDDYNVAREKGAPVACIVPGQGADGPGVLLIPNTAAILADAPRPEAARRFVDWLLREETEALLAASRSAQIPVRAGVPRPAHVLDVSALKLMDVDLLEVGRRLPEYQGLLKEAFLQ